MVFELFIIAYSFNIYAASTKQRYNRETKRIKGIDEYL